MIASAYDVAMLSQQIRKLNATIQLASAGWASTSKMVEMGGAAVEGALISLLHDKENQRPSYLKFLTDYKQRFGESPDFGAVYAYDATQFVIQALQQRQSDEPLKQTILRIKSFDGLQSRVVIDSFGDAERKTFISRVIDGNYTVIK